MILRLKHSLMALAVATLPLAGVAATFTVMGAEAVYAERGNGNGNGGGNGNRGGRSSDRGSQASEDRGNGNGRGGQDSEVRGNGNGRGAIASELKGLNACNASEQARTSADPESQVGRIATYAAAAEQTEVAQGEWQVAHEAYKAYQASYSGPTSKEVQIDLARLDPNSPTYDEGFAAGTNATTLSAELDAALVYETELARLGTAANEELAVYEAAVEQEESALSGASGGRELSDEAVAALRSCLEG